MGFATLTRGNCGALGCAFSQPTSASNTIPTKNKRTTVTPL
jgi:hypothetical protein